MVKKFEKEGMAGLLSSQKGRPSKVPKKPKNNRSEKIKNMNRRLIIKQEAEREKLKLENLV